MPHPALSDAGTMMRATRLGKPVVKGLVGRPVDKALRYRIERADGTMRYVSVNQHHGNSRRFVGARCPECETERPCVKHAERGYLICQQCWCTFWPDGRLAELPPPSSFTNPGQRYAEVPTHCEKGHELTEENSVEYEDGSKRCRTCRRSADQNRRKVKKSRELLARTSPSRLPPLATS